MYISLFIHFLVKLLTFILIFILNNYIKDKIYAKIKRKPTNYRSCKKGLKDNSKINAHFDSDVFEERQRVIKHTQSKKRLHFFVAEFSFLQLKDNVCF